MKEALLRFSSILKQKSRKTEFKKSDMVSGASSVLEVSDYLGTGEIPVLVAQDVEGLTSVQD